MCCEYFFLSAKYCFDSRKTLFVGTYCVEGMLGFRMPAYSRGLCSFHSTPWPSRIGALDVIDTMKLPHNPLWQHRM